MDMFCPVASMACWVTHCSWYSTVSHSISLAHQLMSLLMTFVQFRFQPAGEQVLILSKTVLSMTIVNYTGFAAWVDYFSSHFIPDLFSVLVYVLADLIVAFWISNSDWMGDFVGQLSSLWRGGLMLDTDEQLNMLIVVCQHLWTVTRWNCCLTCTAACHHHYRRW